MQLAIYHEQDKTDLYGMLRRHQLPYKVQVEPIFQKRTMSQNRYYWMVVNLLRDKLGFVTQQKMPEFLLINFAMVEEVVENGELYAVVESTAHMSSMRKERYLEDIRIWARAELDEYIPMPGEIFMGDDDLKVKFIKQ